MSDDLVFQGVYTALLTPFTNEKEIDKEAYENHLKFQIEAGVDGLVVCGTTGESPTFDDDEFTYLVETAVKYADGTCQVIAGSGSNNTQKTIHRSRISKDLGADGLLVVAPYYNKPNQDGMFMHYHTVADSVDLPLMVYNVPGRTSINIEPDTVAQLAEHPNIVAVKEASGDINQVMDVISLVPDDFGVLSGDDALTLPLVAAGGHGIVSVAGNAIPGMMVEYTAAALSGDHDQAKAWHYKLLPLFRSTFLESNPIPIKYALAAMGRMKNELRLPLAPLHTEHEEEVKSVLRNLNLI